jgi:hypothetical protein
MVVEGKVERKHDQSGVLDKIYLGGAWLFEGIGF